MSHVGEYTIYKLWLKYQMSDFLLETFLCFYLLWTEAKTEKDVFVAGATYMM